MSKTGTILGLPMLKMIGSYEKEIDGVAYHIYEVENRQKQDHCPKCGSRGKLHEAVIRRIWDLDSFGVPIFLFYRVNKYDCLDEECRCFYAEDIS